MKLSELKDIGKSAGEASTLPYPASALADPHITAEEARSAETAICRWHGSQYVHLNVEGRVYFCPIGRQVWRHSKKQDGMYAPLKFRF